MRRRMPPEPPVRLPRAFGYIAIARRHRLRFQKRGQRAQHRLAALELPTVGQTRRARNEKSPVRAPRARNSVPNAAPTTAFLKKIALNLRRPRHEKAGCAAEVIHQPCSPSFGRTLAQLRPARVLSLRCSCNACPPPNNVVAGRADATQLTRF